MDLKTFYYRYLGGYFLSFCFYYYPVFKSILSKVNFKKKNDRVLKKLFKDKAYDADRQKLWWEKPGLAVMYQIEHRPGFNWQRNFDKFNATMKDESGSLKFNGPFPRMNEWVALSKKIGCDYHTFEAKWHDGICYWDTPLTEWKTETDYCRQFAEESQRQNIPFGFYYSHIFDHNPDFDDIQPLRKSLTSLIGSRGGKHKTLVSSLGLSRVTRWLFTYFSKDIKHSGEKFENPSASWFDEFAIHDFKYHPGRYIEYVIDQIKDLCTTYNPDCLWLDWWDDVDGAACEDIMDLMENHFPEIAITFNQSTAFDVRWAHYLCSEAHDLKNAWREINKYRRLLRPWELVCPAALNWDQPQPKEDPYDNIRFAALIMASGGKVQFGVPSKMNGTFNEKLVEQLEILGNWYLPRKHLFVDATPMDYKGRGVQGIDVENKNFRTCATHLGEDHLLHLFWLFGKPEAGMPLKVVLNKKNWSHIQRVVLEPNGVEIPIRKTDHGYHFQVNAGDIDMADTIIRLSY